MFRYFAVSGTYYEVGKLVGKQFRDVIQEFYGSAEDFRDLVFIQTASGQKRVFPELVEEMLGLADGAGLTFQQVFTMHLSRELDIARKIKKESGCSDLFINSPDTAQAAAGNNEDINPLIKSQPYIVKVTIHKINQTTCEKLIMEDFTAYTYPGHLPGSTFSFNTAGMMFNMNSLSPEVISYGKIPRHILNRAMLRAVTPDEFEKVLLCDGVGSAYGFSVNIVQLNTNKKTVSMWNYEIAPVAGKPTTSFHRVFKLEASQGFEHNTGFYFTLFQYVYKSLGRGPSTVIVSKC